MHRTIATCLLMFALAGCAPSTLRNESESLNEYYRTHDEPKFQFSQQGQLTLRYLQSGDASKSTIVFIHGTPGDWAAFASFMNEPTLQQQAHLISVDRPGWGGSTFANGQFEPGIEGQSRLMKEWLCEVAAGSATGDLIVVGHSLGGTLAQRLAMDHPHCVSAVMILAGPLDPDLAGPRWYNHLARFPPFGWLADKVVGPGMRQSNKEMMVLKPELEKMRPLWADIRAPVIVIQGGKDGLVNPKHADFAEQMITTGNLYIIRLPDSDHFFLYSNKSLVLQQIRSLLERGAP